MLKIVLLVLAVMLLVLLLVSGCSAPTVEGNSPALSAAFQQYEQSHFGFFRAFKSYPFVDELGVHWERPHPGPFIWGAIQTQAGGGYDWSQVDAYVQEAQQNDVQLVATIWPYADWDQQQCHEQLPDGRRLFSELGNYRQKPCDSAAYEDFVRALVDRYDGDGSNDMPGLKYPIKYWEVDNEPDISDGSLFFKGDPQTGDYLELLEETHDAIKQADPDASVLNGGIAYLNQQDRPFWENILSGPGAQDIDVLTLHSIELGSDLQLPELQQLMQQLGLTQPFWVTEIQYSHARRPGAPGQAPAPQDQTTADELSTAEFCDPESLPPSGLHDLSQEEWSVLLVESFVKAFGRGADKLFYIGLDNGTPTEASSLLVNCQAQPGAGRNDPYDPSSCTRQKPFYAYKTLVDKVDYFDSVQQLADGQYRFSVNGRKVYLLWGSQPPPAEIGGTVTVTDIYGQQQQEDAAAIKLTDSPVYVETEN